MTDHLHLAGMVLQGIISKHGIGESDEDENRLIDAALRISNNLIFEYDDRFGELDSSSSSREKLRS